MKARSAPLFEDLFDADGSVVVLLPADRLVPARALPFAAVVAAASAQGSSAFGYRVNATGAVVMNPSKSSTVTLVPGDQVIAIGARPSH